MEMGLTDRPYQQPAGPVKRGERAGCPPVVPLARPANGAANAIVHAERGEARPVAACARGTWRGPVGAGTGRGTAIALAGGVAPSCGRRIPGRDSPVVFHR